MYAIAKFDVAFYVFAKASVSKRYYMDVDSFTSILDVKIDCDLFMNNSNASIDAFFNSMFDASGELRQSKLAYLIDAPFNCPVAGMANLHYKMSDLVSAFDIYKEGLIDQLYLNNKVEPKKVTSNETVYKNVVAIEYPYKKEIIRLSSSNEPEDILLLALTKHVFEKPKKVNEISDLLESIRNKLETTYYVDDFEIEYYDGSDQAMIGFMRHYSQNQLGGSAFFEIPCAILIENNNLLPAIDPYYGGNRDNFLPRHDCLLSEYPLPSSINDFLSVINIPTQNWLGNHQGSMRHFYYKSKGKEALLRSVFPRLLKSNKKGFGSPFETWSYVNLENRKVFEFIESKYNLAKKDLIEHYINQFNMNYEEARYASVVALSVSVDSGHWGEPPNQGLRYIILQNYPIVMIEQDINSVADLNELTPTELKMSYYGGAWSMIGDPDPLIMMAVKRPDVLKLLLEKNNSFKYEKVKNDNETKRSNPQTHVNSKNSIGKNALHVAVQQNQMKSVQILIKAGIDINAVVSDSGLVHNNRTVAMYAAANADLDLIKYLKEQSVDFTVKDNKGFDVIAYLFGVGVLDMNPHLKLDNIDEFVKLLKPDFYQYQGQKITPRFNCQLAGNYSEKLACDDSYIATLDRMLLIQYKAQLNLSADEGGLKTQQRIWVKQKNICKEYACVKSAYQTRLEQLH